MRSFLECFCICSQVINTFVFTQTRESTNVEFILEHVVKVARKWWGRKIFFSRYFPCDLIAVEIDSLYRICELSFLVGVSQRINACAPTHPFQCTEGWMSNFSLPLWHSWDTVVWFQPAQHTSVRLQCVMKVMTINVWGSIAVSVSPTIQSFKNFFLGVTLVNSKF